MQNTLKLNIPLIVDAQKGNNWNESTTNKYIYAFLLIAAFSNPIKADDSLSPNIKAIVKNSYDQDIKKFKKCVSEEGLIASETDFILIATIVRLERACKNLKSV